jgi:hypothetical protein
MPRGRRTLTLVQKAALVGESEVKGVRPTAREHNVPESSIRVWRADPEFARLRAETREEVAQDVWAAFQVGVKRIVELIPKTDDLSKVAVATGIIYDKAALIAGQATARTESRSLTDGMDDHERAALKRMLTEALEEVEAE